MRGARPWLLLGGGALLTALAAMALALVAQQRRLASVERQLAELGRANRPPIALARVPAGEWQASAPARAERGPASALAPAPAPAQAPAVELAQPSSPEARALVDELQIDARSWDMVLEVNRWWRETVERAQGGDAKFIEQAAVSREYKLRALLHGAAGWARYQQFERDAPGAHTTFQRPDGTRYEAADFQ
jgi:hypothetical protein